jgi:hypothetical protein
MGGAVRVGLVSVAKSSRYRRVRFSPAFGACTGLRASAGGRLVQRTESFSIEHPPHNSFIAKI